MFICLFNSIWNMVKLKIISVESKSGATGNFVRANTDQGWLSAFEEPAKTLILQSIGKELECEITSKQSGDKIYKNIISASLVEGTNSGTTNVQATETTGPNNKYNPTSMYVSYAKDIFNATYNPEDKATSMEMRMGECIRLVKQARDAFS